MLTRWERLVTTLQERLAIHLIGIFRLEELQEVGPHLPHIFVYADLIIRFKGEGALLGLRGSALGFGTDIGKEGV